jgi:hypothetical protein
LNSTHESRVSDEIRDKIFALEDQRRNQAEKSVERADSIQTINKDQHRQNQLKIRRERAQLRRKNETEEQRQIRLGNERERARSNRRNETAEQRQARLKNERERTDSNRRNETAKQRQARLENKRERTESNRRNETAEQRQARLENKRERTDSNRRNETAEQRQARLENERERSESNRRNETAEQHQVRVNQQRNRTVENRKKTKTSRHKFCATNRDRQGINAGFCERSKLTLCVNDHLLDSMQGDNLSQQNGGSKSLPWPAPISCDVKEALLQKFLEQMSMSTLEETTCAVCNVRVPVRKSKKLPVSKIPNTHLLQVPEDLRDLIKRENQSKTQF